MAHIEDADYETISVTCDACGAKLRLNRRDDLAEFEAITGQTFKCVVCGIDFWITGDTCGTVFEMFIFSADEHFESKHHMLAVMSLAQAWEIFLATFAYSNYVYRPFWLERRHVAGLDPLNNCLAILHKNIDSFNLGNLLNLTANTILHRLHPHTLDEAEPMIAKITRDGPLHRDSKAADIATIVDDDVRIAVQRLLKLRIADLRNRVGHKEAYRPSADEVRFCREDEIIFLHYIRDLFGVGDFDEFGAGVVETPRWFS